MPRYTGAGPMPTPSVLQQLATEAYNKSPVSTVGGLQLVTYTPTLKFYKSPTENTIVVAIRGTEPTDGADVKADASIAIGQLQNSQRFQQDLATLLHFQAQYPFTDFDYYGVGHSLGGAILDVFLKMGLLKQGISYNPAIQPGDFQATIPNKRIYNQEDPLYKLMGRYATNTEVRAPRKKSWWERAIEKVPYAGKAYNLYKAHQLDNFVGGGHFTDLLTSNLRQLVRARAARVNRKLSDEEVKVLDRIYRKAKSDLNNAGKSNIELENRTVEEMSVESEKYRIVSAAVEEFIRALATFEPVGRKSVRRSAEFPIGLEAPRHGESMVDFEDEAKLGRHYTAEDVARFDKLENPMTRKQIDVLLPYKADVKSRVADVLPAPTGALPPQSSLTGYGGGRVPTSKFGKQLQKAGISPSAYLKEARRRAERFGYPSHLLGFADDDVHKLAIPDKDGKLIRFGAVGYNDHQLWKALESQGKAPKGIAEKKRETFQSSHSKIKGNWRSDEYSPNNLALKVLW